MPKTTQARPTASTAVARGVDDAPRVGRSDSVRAPRQTQDLPLNGRQWRPSPLFDGPDRLLAAVKAQLRQIRRH